MNGRPCKPDADLKGLWRALLGTPFPACGISEDSEEARAAETADDKNHGVKQAAEPAGSDGV